MVPQYFAWHYGKGLSQAIGLAQNAVLFALHIWSVGELFRTFFSPWRMVVVPHQREEAITAFASAIWYNLLSRMIGAAVRTVALSLGLAHAAVMAGLGIAIVVFWILGPFLPALFILGALGALI